MGTMLLLPFRITSARAPADSCQVRLLSELLNERLSTVGWAEHQRIHVSRAGLVGAVFCVERRREEAHRALPGLLAATVGAIAAPAEWRVETYE
ncbi:hypothetical protein [Streptomyces sp. NPDC060194]|uniref:hypothetical protein n=1 Tax=Streptomyces sp. NPDC060194 TaxID=3347069 RepID=UPI00364F0D84